MNKQEAIIKLQNILNDDIYGWTDNIEKAFKIAIDSLQKSAQLEQQWIPCSNTVDIPDYEVLCCDKRGNELIGWLFDSNGQWICESKGEIMYGTIAWMLLPEPYRGKGDK